MRASALSLATILVVASLAGVAVAASADASTASTTPGVAPDESVADRTGPDENDSTVHWPSFAYDAANTGVAPNESGPTAEREVRWTFSTGGRPVPRNGPCIRYHAATLATRSPTVLKAIPAFRPIFGPVTGHNSKVI